MSNVQPPYPGDSEGARNDDGTGSLPKYPNMPPQGPPPEAEQLPQPSSIHTAVQLMWVGAAISLIGLIVGLATLGSLKDQIRDQLDASGQTVTQDLVDTAYAGAIVFTAVVGIIGILLWLWMAWKNGQGRNWARIVATVLGVLNVLSVLYTATAGAATSGATILSIINLILAIAILVLLWRKESTAFYQDTTRRAHQYGT